MLEGLAIEFSIKDTCVLNAYKNHKLINYPLNAQKLNKQCKKYFQQERIIDIMKIVVKNLLKTLFLKNVSFAGNIRIAKNAKTIIL